MENSRRIIIAGGSGLIGTCLSVDLVAKGFEVVILTRGRERVEAGGKVRFTAWDGKTLGDWCESLSGSVAVVNLAGRSINCRHTKENREQIVKSRLDSVKAIKKALESCARPPGVWVQASALAIYGDSGDQWCGEGAPHAEDFPARACREWEAALEGAAPDGVRPVILRIGIVLRRGGGALGTLENLVRGFLGGAAGNGQQYISWLHWKDMNRIVMEAIENPEIRGPYNACAPCPVTNAVFMGALRFSLNRPWCPPAPGIAVKFGAMLMGTDPSLALTGRRCRPERLRAHGFKFLYPNLNGALRELYGG